MGVVLAVGIGSTPSVVAFCTLAQVGLRMKNCEQFAHRIDMCDSESGKQISTPERPEQQSKAVQTEQPATTEAVLLMNYRGMQRTTELPFTQQMIMQLAFEAGCRNMTVGQVQRLLDIFAGATSFESCVLRPTWASYS